MNDNALPDEGTDEIATLALETALPKQDARSRKHSEVRKRTQFVGLRLLPGELETLQAAAEDRNVSLSELIRSSALKAAGG